MHIKPENKLLAVTKKFCSQMDAAYFIPTSLVAMMVKGRYR
jgi:hypothetical protein